MEEKGESRTRICVSTSWCVPPEDQGGREGTRRHTSGIEPSAPVCGPKPDKRALYKAVTGTSRRAVLAAFSAHQDERERKQL